MCLSLEWNYAYYFGKYLSNMNIFHTQVIQGCRGVNASLESQVENKWFNKRRPIFCCLFLLPDTCQMKMKYLFCENVNYKEGEIWMESNITVL
jgi:hypothetical protein